MAVGLEFIKKSAEQLIQSRPTAINLKWAVDRMMKKISGINSDKIFNLAFDVTPAKYVTALITERGICEASEDGLKRLFK